MAKYEAVKTDMTYEQACQVIGFAGEESSRNSIGGTETVLYIWHGGFGANMNATFQNNRLVSKAQFGLK